MVTINIGRKEAVFFGVIILVFAVVGLGVAYNSVPANPAVMGHSAGEIEGGVVSGAVIAFNLASCPAGWVEFTSARGRVVLG